MPDPRAMATAIRTALGLLSTTAAKGAPANTVIDLGPLIQAWSVGSYAVGDVRMHNGYPWRCCQAHSSAGNPGWSPGAVVALWAPYHATDVAHALPWVKPTGAQDAYQVGECVIWTDGKVFRCKITGCVYSPTEYTAGWEVVYD